MEPILRWLAAARGALDITLVRLGDTPITLWTVIYITVLVALLAFGTSRLRRAVSGLLARSGVTAATRNAVATLLSYAFITIGLVIVLQTAGIDLTAITVLMGAIGIGIGFGLQNIANNFISGLIILIERPIKVGDRIEVGDVHGRVIAIRARSTTVVTNDNIAIVIPNASLISEDVINWSHSDDDVRFRVPVGVAYGSDTRLVERLLLEVAKANPHVLDEPPPGVAFLGFGDSSLDFELRVWTRTRLHRRGALVSELNFAMDDAFRANGVEIPFPQRDLHLRSGWTPAGQDR